MIRTLEMQNFKSFREPVNIDFHPINLVYGENSAGKSSVIQALLLLKQSWRSAGRATSDENLLEFRGSYIDLGGFGATVTDHDYLQNKLSIGFSVGRRRAGPANPFTIQGSSYSFSFGSDRTRKPHLHAVTMALPNGTKVRFQLTAKGSTVALFVADAESARAVISLWIEFEEFSRVASGSGARRTRERRQIADEDISWMQGWLRKTPCALVGLLPAWSPDELREGRPGRPLGGSLDSPKRQLLQEFVFSWQYWMSNLFTYIANRFETVKYVGPLRRAPQRLIVETSEASRELGPRGEQALRVLAGEPMLLRDINRSLEILEIPYTLEIRELAGEAETIDIGDISVLSLVDRRNGTNVTLGDVGVGVSQVLPVLMQLLLHRNSIILVEQPELHLHPRLQSRLADILVQSAIERKNSLIIETHSEHLLVRLQRRIRERQFRREDLQVLYVGNDSGDSHITRIELTPDGDMVGGRPGGFFDDRLSDILGSE